MSHFRTEQGAAETLSARVASTSAETLVDAGDSGCFVEDALVSNTGSGTPDITLDRYDGTTAFVLVQEHSLAAKSTESTELGVPKSIFRLTMNIYLNRNELLRITSTVGSNAVHVHTTVVRPN